MDNDKYTATDEGKKTLHKDIMSMNPCSSGHGMCKSSHYCMVCGEKNSYFSEKAHLEEYGDLDLDCKKDSTCHQELKFFRAIFCYHCGEKL